MTERDIRAVVPVYAQHHLTAALLDDVAREAIDVSIVDNEGGYEPFGSETVLRPGTNLGWAGGCNYGMARAFEEGCELCVLLNNDTRLSRGFFAGLNQAWIDSRAGLVAPVFNDVWPQHYVAHQGSAEEYVPAVATRAVGFVDGTCMAVPRSTYRAVGALDADRFGHFGWGAEMDYSLRVRGAGLAVVVTERSFLTHVRQATGRALCAEYEVQAGADMNAGMTAKWGRDWQRLLDDPHCSGSGVASLPGAG